MRDLEHDQAFLLAPVSEHSSSEACLSEVYYILVVLLEHSVVALCRCNCVNIYLLYKNSEIILYSEDNDNVYLGRGEVQSQIRLSFSKEYKLFFFRMLYNEDFVFILYKY